MGTLGTFDSFTTARLGIYAAQQGLKVTGNNISNINTAGYTRQRIDQVSFKTGVYDRYRSMMDNHIGSGTLVTDINQIRDPYLDIRYRTTTTDTYYYDTKLGGLEEIASILDEVGKGIKDGDNMSKGDGLLYAQLQTLSERLRDFSASPTKENEILVQSAASTLTSMFNNYAGKLEKLRQDYEKDFGDNVTAVNKVLLNIRDLNKSIRTCEINGDNALEMRDERNRQIDELSKYMSIKVQYSMEDVGAGIMVEKLTILMGDSNPDPNVETDSSMLVDGLYCTQLSVPKERPVLNPDYGSTDPAKADLKDYLYTKEVPVYETDADGNYVLDADGNKIPVYKKDPDVVIDPDDPDPPDGLLRDENGKLIQETKIVGTNDAADEGIITEKNDNYTVQLGKLLDVHDKEWESSETTWDEVTATPDGAKASYQYAIKLGKEKFEDGDQISIGGKDFTVGQGDLTEDIANDAAQLADFIAKNLTKDGYDISANGSYIVLTAQEVGLVKPDDAPALELTDGGDKISLGARKTISNGAEKDETLPNGSSTDENGTETVIAYTEIEGKYYKVTIETKHTHEIALDDNDLDGILQAQRELLTEEGEFCSTKDVGIDENAAIKRGIPYYQKAFDLLAQKFAEAYNQLNQGYMLNEKGNYVNKDGEELTIAGDPVNRYEPLSAAQKAALTANPPDYCQTDKDGNLILDEDGNPVPDLDAWLEAYSELEGGPVKMGGPLFSNHNDGDDTTGITAANITISHSWNHGAVELIPKFEVLFKGDVEHSTQNINADHMVSMIDKALSYNPSDLNDSDAIGPLMFKGSFNDMFSYIMGVQAEDASKTNVRLITSNTTLVELDSAREGVSGVDLNDEAMNMMQYQKAYSAACRLMTVIDEALDRLINNTGVVGR